MLFFSLLHVYRLGFLVSFEISSTTRLKSVICSLPCGPVCKWTLQDIESIERVWIKDRRSKVTIGSHALISRPHVRGVVWDQARNH